MKVAFAPSCGVGLMYNQHRGTHCFVNALQLSDNFQHRRAYKQHRPSLALSDNANSNTELNDDSRRIPRVDTSHSMTKSTTARCTTVYEHDHLHHLLDVNGQTTSKSNATKSSSTKTTATSGDFLEMHCVSSPQLGTTSFLDEDVNVANADTSNVYEDTNDAHQDTKDDNEDTTDVNEDTNDTENEIITLNVSGFRFETYLRTLHKHPNSLLGNPLKRARYYIAERGEYFFDRSRTSFEAILDFYRCDHLQRCVLLESVAIMYSTFAEDSSV
jgi:hypothetical protein